MSLMKATYPGRGFAAGYTKYSSGATKNRFYSSGEESANLLPDSEGGNCYCCFFSFKEASRKAKYAAESRTLFLDIDAGVSGAGRERDYPTKYDALKAVQYFLKDKRVPCPTIIDSGHGWHLLWILNDALNLDQWKLVQNALVHLAADSKLYVDQAAALNCTAGYRVPGSYNIKQAGTVPVKLTHVQEQGYGTELVSHLLESLDNSGIIVEASPRKRDGALELPGGFPPVHYSALENNCAQLNWVITHQRQVDEPLWRLVLGLAKFTSTPEQAAVRWSEHHHGYDKAQTLAKLDAYSAGPPLCKTMALYGKQDKCQLCHWQGKVSTPLQVGVDYTKAAPSEDAASEGDSEQKKEDEEAEEEREVCPKGFFRNDAHGVITTDVETQLQTVVCPNNLWFSELTYDAGENVQTVNMHWRTTDLTKTIRTVRVPIKDLLIDLSGNYEVLTSKGIILKKSQVALLGMYIREYLAELSKDNLVLDTYTAFGWKQDDTQFALGNTLYALSDGEVTRHTVRTDSCDEVHDAIKCKGDATEWKRLTSLFDKPGMGLHGFILLAGAGAPLMKFSGLGGGLINMFGPSGTGKSTLHAWINSIWGDPRGLELSANATFNKLIDRAATHGNLPINIDEITNLSPQARSNLAYTISYGRDRGRLTDPVTKSWSLIGFTSSNSSVLGSLSSIKADASAEMMRCLEFTIPPTDAIASVGGDLMLRLNNNYGHAAQLLIPTYLKLPNKAQLLVEDTPKKIQAEFGISFTGPERFWLGMFSCAYIAGVCLEALGLINFNWRNSIRAGLNGMVLQRSVVSDATLTSEELISLYVNANISSSVVQILDEKGGNLGPPIALPRNSLVMRLEIYNRGSKTSGTLYLARTPFSNWLAERSASYAKVRADMKSHGALLDTSQKAMGAGSVGRVTVMSLDLSHKLFADIPATIPSLSETA